MPFYLRPIAEQHALALNVKTTVPVIVCLGNPPYDRHDAVDATGESLSKYGGWVRFGERLTEERVKGITQKEVKGKRKAKEAKVVRPPSKAEVLHRREKLSILYRAFVEPALAAGHGGQLKWFYNLYVYFWRWALWKVFEHTTASGPGVVSFISASSYLDGDAFCGMREHMRRLCDEIWVLDLGGEGRGTRKSENVFAIQTPVAIALAVRYGDVDRDSPAKIHFARVVGTRDEKLKALDAIQNLTALQWRDCPDDWHAPFRPVRTGVFFGWPRLIDLFPWQHSGLMVKRTWPISSDPGILKRRWRALLRTNDRAGAYRETRDRKVIGTYPPLYADGQPEKPIGQLRPTPRCLA